MSKGSSALFKGTQGEQIFTNEHVAKIKIKAETKVKDMISNQIGGRIKSMAVGAYDVSTGKTTASFAGAIPTKIHPELIARASKIGGIGSLV